MSTEDIVECGNYYNKSDRHVTTVKKIVESRLRWSASIVIVPSFLKDIFVRNRILNWQVFVSVF